MRPPYAYVPGLTPRHPDGLFDEWKETLPSLSECPAWKGGWACLEGGFFWEAHELFEPVWMQTRPETAERHMAQAAIQLANAALKLKMGRHRAVLRLCDDCESLLALIGCRQVLGVSPSRIRNRLVGLRHLSKLIEM
ncbi:DUF309 domain-containing protein [Primorskyibacter sp. S87]|uniref:DUF309 domain-containing protein n=1 Tax=Primorskyibacter sp. S87 TaxID=3415126 RepID=UPI003C7C7552